ncbi:MAG: 16S rRNA (uracil(1498)-N(3))-methyltransferase [Saprospiraceae bacterium]|nr:16S rRNA (uracil(1498)-N(3))-methyltransferase [Saprospiraceae bacterium]
MHLFIGQRQNDGLFGLTTEEGHHCIRVTRHKPGDFVMVTDFQGEIWKTIILDQNGDRVLCKPIEIYKREMSIGGKIHIAISLTQQSDRFEWFLEKAVETGIDTISPLMCQRTENRRDKPERWSKIIMAAAKQTLRARLPELKPIQNLEQVLKTNQIEQRFICHCENGTEGFLGKLYIPSKDIIVLIGPEGDFTKPEIELCQSHKFIPVHLGELRLRTETAGLTACIILQTLKNCL